MAKGSEIKKRKNLKNKTGQVGDKRDVLRISRPGPIICQQCKKKISETQRFRRDGVGRTYHLGCFPLEKW